MKAARAAQSWWSHLQLRDLDPHHKADPMADAEWRAVGPRRRHGVEAHGRGDASRLAHHQIPSHAARSHLIYCLGGLRHTPTRRRRGGRLLFGERVGALFADA